MLPAAGPVTLCCLPAPLQQAQARTDSRQTDAPWWRLLRIVPCNCCNCPPCPPALLPCRATEDASARTSICSYAKIGTLAQQDMSSLDDMWDPADPCSHAILSGGWVGCVGKLDLLRDKLDLLSDGFCLACAAWHPPITSPQSHHQSLLASSPPWQACCCARLWRTWSGPGGRWSL